MLLHYRLWPYITSAALRHSNSRHFSLVLPSLPYLSHVRAATHALEMSELLKPSIEAKPTSNDTIVPDYVQINNIIFATSDDVKTSLKEVQRKTEVWTLTERLGNIEKICTIPKLTSSNWNSYFESIKRLISVTETACVFLPVTPSTKAIIIWSAWWAAKLKESASHIKINDNETPLFVLTTIVSQTQAAMRSNLIEIINRFWTFQPSNNMSLSKFFVEYEIRLNEFKQNNTITPELKRQMKYLLLSSIQKLDSNLAIRCRNCSFEELLAECYQYKRCYSILPQM
ncbi:BgTH12-07111 [Blumeria graminis f. sp. triticale]|uniref:BgTH12-07111 n=1 Tax=Blumeria graminis f. sp. triticale TaxID=1689686 RepID=A0A9W4GIF7_BLUGR|nr:BgTH12-07111 [Blumeria graminis f. sp. triticale]